MKKTRKFLLILLILSVEHVAYSQQVTYVGIPREQFDYFSSGQRNSQWCWAASIQMIFNYYGINFSQEQIVARSYGTDPFGRLPDWSGSLQVITANLNNWSIDNNGTQYMVQSSVYGGAPTPAFLIEELSNQRPVLVGYRSGPGSGHAVVITACSYIQTFNGPLIQSIVVRDPWPSQQNIANNGRAEYHAAEFANAMMSHWYIRITQ